MTISSEQLPTVAVRFAFSNVPLACSKPIVAFITRLLLNALAGLLIVAAPCVEQAQAREKIIYSFQGLPDGVQPEGRIVFDAAGNLYGATVEGGGGSGSCDSFTQCGTIYELSPPSAEGDAWAESVLYVFRGNAEGDGAGPYGGLVIDSAGNLYGTTEYGGTGNCVLLGVLTGCGTVFELSPPNVEGGSWNETILYSFPDPEHGWLPQGNLLRDSAGNLFGPTSFGGGFGTTCDIFFQYCGEIFELSPPAQKGGAWTAQVLHGFAGSAAGDLFGDGASPNGDLVLDSVGNLYGTTYSGGNWNCRQDGFLGCGTVFRLSPPANKGDPWVETILHRFNYGASDGSNPMAGLVIDASGSLYAVTLGEGGTVVRFEPPHKFDGDWSETILHHFRFKGGYDPEGLIAFDASGNLYGTTYTGSADTLGGTVFRLSPPQSKADGWAWQVLYPFGSGNAPEAFGPNSPVVLDDAGNLYSTTQYGGTGTGCTFTGCGTVFELEP